MLEKIKDKQEKHEKHEVTIRISNISTEIESIQENTKCSVLNLIISEGNLIRVHKGVGSINNVGGKKIKLLFNDLEEVELPEDIYRNLLTYINNEQSIISNWLKINGGKGIVDCNSFVSFVYGIGMGDRSKIFNITEGKTLSKINPGDIVFLENKLDCKQGNYHFAIYLGKGLYISKFSDKGIGITELKELENLYNPTNISILGKKNSKAS